MVSTYARVLLGLCVFTLLFLWDFPLQTLLTGIAQRRSTEHENISDSLGSDTSGIPKPRILCWVLTGPQNHMNKSLHVKRTWGSRCDKLLFMSSVEDPRLGTIKLDGVTEGHGKLWPKTQKAFEYAWHHHRDDADWFLKADDDTYVFVDNLRRFLKDFDSSDPHYFGSVVRWTPKFPQLNAGGPGYVLSREALRRFVEIALVKGGDCFTGIRPDYKGDEDSEIALCLRSVGMPPELTNDPEGRCRFCGGNPLTAFSDMPKEYNQSWNHGPTWLSNRAISYHPVRPHEIYVLEYLTHYLETHY